VAPAGQRKTSLLTTAPAGRRLGTHSMEIGGTTSQAASRSTTRCSACRLFRTNRSAHQLEQLGLLGGHCLFLGVERRRRPV
jgi:hypothetical protein